MCTTHSTIRVPNITTYSVRILNGWPSGIESSCLSKLSREHPTGVPRLLLNTSLSYPRVWHHSFHSMVTLTSVGLQGLPKGLVHCRLDSRLPTAVTSHLPPFESPSPRHTCHGSDSPPWPLWLPSGYPSGRTRPLNHVTERVLSLIIYKRII